MNKNCLCSWSGGKDSCFALMQAILQGFAPKALLNVLNEEGKISRSHGIPSFILQKQAAVTNIPIRLISSSWKDYEKHFTSALQTLKEEYSLTHAVFGDIDLQPHRDWEEKVCANAGLTAVLPLWQQNRKKLVMQMLETGIEAIIVSCNDQMGQRFIGKSITPELVEELESMGVDACGENGEFHTLVLDCPIFANKINASVARVLQHESYWFAELV
jgi:uncharacterized protein (TIGR00290 family)